jgi:copper transport protein
LLLQTGAAFAHATLVSSDPVDGTVLPAAPSRLALTFNEPVSPLFLRLIDDRGGSLELRYRLADATVVADQLGTIAQGTHILSWRVISADGHPVGGSIVFSVGAPSTGKLPAASEAIDWPLRIAIWNCRLAIYLAFFVGVGGTFFRAWFMENVPAGRRVHLAVLAAGLIAVPASVGLQGLDAQDLRLTEIGRAVAWQTGMSTTWGITAVLAVVAVLAALIASNQEGRSARALSIIAMLGVGAALSASGHASNASPQYLTRPAVFVHTLAVAFWIGALIPLGGVLRGADGRIPLMRFSAAIPFAIGSLIAAGLFLAVVQVEKPSLLWSTDYGRVLLLKLALVLVLFLLAAANRWRLTRLVEAGNSRATRRLVIAIFVEFGLAIAILGTVATWRFTPPPRALEAAAMPASVHIHTPSAMAQVTLTPGHAGPVVASIEILTGDLTALDAKEVTLILSNPDAGIEPIKRPATKVSELKWEVRDLVLPVAGRWDIEVAILVSDFDLVRLRDKIDIRN